MAQRPRPGERRRPDGRGHGPRDGPTPGSLLPASSTTHPGPPRRIPAARDIVSYPAPARHRRFCPGPPLSALPGGCSSRLFGWVPRCWSRPHIPGRAANILSHAPTRCLRRQPTLRRHRVGSPPSGWGDTPPGLLPPCVRCGTCVRRAASAADAFRAPTIPRPWWVGCSPSTSWCDPGCWPCRSRWSSHLPLGDSSLWPARTASAAAA